MIRPGPLLPGVGGGVEPQSARALDDHGVAGTHPRPLQRRHHRGHGAVDRRQCLVRQVAVDPEDELPRLQEVVVGEASVAVRVLAHRTSEIEVRRAVRVFATDAVVAAMARRVVGEEHPIPFLQPLAKVVCGDARPERVYPSGELVTGDEPVRLAFGVLHHDVAAPYVQVRPAYSARAHPDQDAPVLHRRNSVLPNIDLARSGQHSGSSRQHHGVPPSLLICSVLSGASVAVASQHVNDPPPAARGLFKVRQLTIQRSFHASDFPERRSA